MKIQDFINQFAAQLSGQYPRRSGQCKTAQNLLGTSFNTTPPQHNKTHLDSRDAADIFLTYEQLVIQAIANGKKNPQATPWIESWIGTAAIETARDLAKQAIDESLDNTQSLNQTQKKSLATKLYGKINFQEIGEIVEIIEGDEEYKGGHRIAKTNNSDKEKAELANVAMFQETLRISNSKELQQKVALMRYNTDVFETGNQGILINHTCPPSEDVRPTIGKPKQQHRTQVTVVDKDSFSTAQEQKTNALVLDMANKRMTAGGVTKGSRAQEEDLCRCSTLYKGLELWSRSATAARDKGRLEYIQPIPEFGSMYVPGVTVIRDPATKKLLDQKNYFEVDVVAMAGYDLGKPNLLEGQLQSAYYASRKAYDSGKKDAFAPFFRVFKDAMKEKIRHLLDVAIYTKHDNLVLGALSCGAFRLREEQPGETARVVAEAYKEVLQENIYCQAFKSITFAVLSDKQQNNNFDIFSKTLQGLDLSPKPAKASNTHVASSGLFSPSSSSSISSSSASSNSASGNVRSNNIGECRVSVGNSFELLFDPNTNRPIQGRECCELSIPTKLADTLDLDKIKESLGNSFYQEHTHNGYLRIKADPNAFPMLIGIAKDLPKKDPGCSIM